MLNEIFKGLFDTEFTSVISIGDFLLCIGVSLVLGIILAFGYSYRSRYTKSFVTTLAILPAVVCVVIMMVNGNVGAGVAVAGAFSLVRFRSVPGTAKEIGTLFLAMSTGLILGMGYIAFGIIFTVIMSLIFAIYNRIDFGTGRASALYHTISITIPEDLSYNGVFDPVFEEYTSSYELTKVKSVNMGSMFRLTYDLTMKKPLCEKEMIDKIRERNGNLEITLSLQDTSTSQL